MFKRLNRANSGQIDLREQEVLEGRRLRAASFSACHSLPRWFTGLAAAGVGAAVFFAALPRGILAAKMPFLGRGGGSGEGGSKRLACVA